MGETPTPPDSIPKYIHEGMEKQDIGTLRDIQQFAEELIEHKDRPVEIPDDAEPVEDNSGKGTVVKEKVKCGDDTCHCADGEKHGPYLYRYYRDESGSTVSEYVGKP